MLDCMGVDFQKTDPVAVPVFDFQDDQDLYAWVITSTHAHLMPETAGYIRGPPYHASPDFTQPPLYLSTQRIRI